ncbi:unnamed protein product [Schistosoma mansoni]|uniref:Smp_204720 n=1 Tax=Schistosoma mansoni TaxID=6183 RepID=UPI00022C86F6|nr:unnamed protein product [Schistosoma mansoni]|eukprot:XP_018644667.1 unnamed protein product [Schistosoma mansoni]
MYKDFYTTSWLSNKSLDDHYKKINNNNNSSSNSNGSNSNSNGSNSNGNDNNDDTQQLTPLNELKPKSIHKVRSKKQLKCSHSQSHSHSHLPNNHDRYKNKQMELWQFILYRLQMSKTSSFQWVNKSTGLFRIINTQLAAKEWGHYRNNKLMDYEKMARAISIQYANRFYYKDSILRKSRQQLHFQFAMPYVKWAENFYEK